jgi:hypothetical protein
VAKRIEFHDWKRKAEPAEWIEQLAWLMDEAIPLPGGWTIGLDGIIGLIPGFGDWLGGIISGVIVVAAARTGIPRAAILRMLMNVGIDTFVGSIPIVGDVFDFAYKSNTKNIRIFREHLKRERTAAKDWAFIILTVVVLLILAAIPVVAVALLVHFLRH